MIRTNARWAFLAVSVLSVVAVACGDDASPGAPAQPTAGAAGATTGKGGAGGTQGDAGAAGTQGGSGAGAIGGKAGAGGKGGPGGGGEIPKTCDAAHGQVGCCGPDGNAYYFDNGIQIENCADDGKVCGFAEGEEAGTGFYTCVDKTAADPSGTFPLACGGDRIEEAGCEVPCTADTECKESGAPACKTESGECVECLTDDHCKGSQYGSVCDTKTNLCGCSTDAHCSESPSGGKCVEGSCTCVANTDCKDAAKPACVTFDTAFGSFQTCSECGEDAQCSGKGDKKFCDTDSFTCSVCDTDFDCTVAAKGKCIADEDGVKSCGSADVCTGDDDREPADDGVTGATELSDDTEISGKICDAGDESDYFKFNAADADAVTLTVVAADTKQSIYLYVYNATGDLQGLALHGSTDELKLTYLPAGTYYVQVKVLGGQTPAPAAKGYTIKLARTAGNKCKVVADCASEFAHQLFRGECDTASGACKTITADKTKNIGEVCNEDKNCATGSCGGSIFGKNQDKISVCSADCAGSMGAPDDKKCEEGVCGLFLVCAPQCTVDEECPVDGLTATPASGKPWAYVPCVKGKCTPPE